MEGVAHYVHERGRWPGQLISRGWVLALLLAACKPASTRTSTTRAPADSPVPPALAVERIMRLEAVAVELPRRYTAMQGELVSGLATPWAQETAEQLGVELPWVARAVSIVEQKSGRQPVILTSPAHSTGQWTYARSDSAGVYQVLPVRTDVVPFERLAVLAAEGPPDAQIIDVFAASWILGLMGREGEPSVMLRLRTQIPHEAPGLWDVIDTSLRVVEGELVVEIGYGHSGGGDPCDQRFTFHVRAEGEAEARLVLLRLEHQEGACGVLGTGAEP
jgi:hypothetical protein